MSVHYRFLRAHEEVQAVAFWSQVLEISEDEARRTVRDFRDEPGQPVQTYIAVDPDGQILATVCFWLRTIRNSLGDDIRIGHLFHVATATHARRQGHATRLLNEAFSVLQAHGCQWAILSARQEAVALYQRAGWVAINRRYWRGTFSPESWSIVHRYTVQPFDPRNEANGWSLLASAYTLATAHQSGSLLRTRTYWEGYGAWMFGLYLDLYHAMLLIVRDTTMENSIRGYALVNFYDIGFAVTEFIADPQDPQVTSSLLNGIILEATQRGLPLQGQVIIPEEAQTVLTVQQLFGSTAHTVDDATLHGYIPFMVRPIEEGTENPFTAPGALFWPLDAY